MGKRSRDLWIIDYTSPDTSLEGPVAYESKKEALEDAASWIKDHALQDLEDLDEGDEEDEDGGDVAILNSVLKAISEKRLEDAVGEWLDYQGDTDPSEQIAIGPSGNVCNTLSDFLYVTGHARGNPSRTKRCDLHEEVEECRRAPASCRWGGCDAHSDYGGPSCKTPARHYDDTKSFFCDEGRKQFLKDYRWDDDKGWVDKDGNQG